MKNTTSTLHNVFRLVSNITGTGLVALLLILLCAGGFSSRSYAVSENVHNYEHPNDDQTGNCPGENGAALAKQLVSGAANFQVAQENAYISKKKTVLKAEKDNPQTNVHGNIEKTYCIEDIKLYFKTLRQLIQDLKAFIIQMIEWAIEYILEKICQMIIDAIETLLEMICIPLPDISLPSLTLPSLPGTSCSGISLGDFVKVEKAAPIKLNLKDKIDMDKFTEPLTRYIPDDISLRKTLTK